MIAVWFSFFKQKTAYEVRISDWSSDVCSSDLPDQQLQAFGGTLVGRAELELGRDDGRVGETPFPAYGIVWRHEGQQVSHAGGQHILVVLEIVAFPGEPPEGA